LGDKRRTPPIKHRAGEEDAPRSKSRKGLLVGVGSLNHMQWWGITRNKPGILHVTLGVRFSEYVGKLPLELSGGRRGGGVAWGANVLFEGRK